MDRDRLLVADEMMGEGARVGAGSGHDADIGPATIMCDLRNNETVQTTGDGTVIFYMHILHNTYIECYEK